MVKTVCGDPSETFELYGLARAQGEPAPSDDEAAQGRWRRQTLLVELARLGIQGWPLRHTLTTTGEVPESCQSCLDGRGFNLCVTTLCNRDCSFCFSPKPGVGSTPGHGLSAGDLPDAVELAAEARAASLGIGGGEPLLEAERVLALVGSLKARYGAPLRVEIATNGDLLTPALAQALREAGADGLRINLAARDYDPAPVATALVASLGVAVEIPAIPQDEPRVMRLMDALESLRAPSLILHELFAPSPVAGSGRPAPRGGLALDGVTGKAAWRPFPGSEETAYRLLAYALRRKLSLPVYYCSGGTHEWIAENALARSS